MWNEDASLAHQLLADGGRQWSAQTPGLDLVVGPAETEAFVKRYQQDVGNVFAPRTLVVDGAERLAYTWDVTRRDGTVSTGADLNLLRDGLVVANWTSVSADGRSPLPDGPGAGDLDRAALAAAVAGAHPWHGDLVIDVPRQTVAGTWTDGTRGGIAVLVLVNGRIDGQWVLPGTRPLPAY